MCTYACPNIVVKVRRIPVTRSNARQTTNWFCWKFIMLSYNGIVQWAALTESFSGESFLSHGAATLWVIVLLQSELQTTVFQAYWLDLRSWNIVVDPSWCCKSTHTSSMSQFTDSHKVLTLPCLWDSLFSPYLVLFLPPLITLSRDDFHLIHIHGAVEFHLISSRGHIDELFISENFWFKACCLFCSPHFLAWSLSSSFWGSTKCWANVEVTILWTMFCTIVPLLWWITSLFAHRKFPCFRLNKVLLTQWHPVFTWLRSLF